MIGIVMRSKVVSKVDGGIGWEWYIVTNPFGRHGVDILNVSRSCALEYIRENGLVEVLETEDGVIWDTRSQSFRSRYGGLTREQESRIDYIWK